MSDRLAVSASLSVMMMSIYVLFGGDATAMPIGPGQFQAPRHASAPELPESPAQLLHTLP